MAGRISDDLAMKKTGKIWSQWLALLDKAGAKKMSHRQIAEHLESLSVPGGWSQMIAVTYEQERVRANHGYLSSMTSSPAQMTWSRQGKNGRSRSIGFREFSDSKIRIYIRLGHTAREWLHS